MFIEFTKEVLASSVVSAILVAILAFLFRSWLTNRLKQSIKHEYDHLLESHKSQLKSQSETNLERLRADLAIAASEKQFKFAKLHEQRANVIAETYSLLKQTHLKLGNYVKIFEPAGDKPIDERRQDFIDAFNSFIAFYPTKRIFLPKQTVEKVDSIYTQINHTYHDFFYGVDMVEKARGDSTKKWMALFEKVRDEMTEALEEMENEFRKLLGDEG